MDSLEKERKKTAENHSEKRTYLTQNKFSEMRSDELHNGERNDVSMKKNDCKDLEELEEFLGPKSEIGARLRAFYTSIEQKEIPTRFFELLAKLEEVEEHAILKKDELSFKNNPDEEL